MSTQSTTPTWAVKSRDAWDTLYQESISYYWNMFEEDQLTDQTELYDIYHSMGVSNIERAPATKSGSASPLATKEGDNLGEAVIFYDKLPCASAIAGPNSVTNGDEVKQQLIKIIPNYTDSPYIPGKPISSSNGWSALNSSMVVKLPNRSLIGVNVAPMLEIINYQKLDELCQRMLQRDLYSFYQFLIDDPQAPKNADTVRIHLAESIEPYGPCTQVAVVKIPEMLVLLGILDSLNSRYQAQHADPELSKAFAKVDRAIYKPLTTLLSNYISMGLYFPLGFNMVDDANLRPLNSLTGVRSNTIKALLNRKAAIEPNECNANIEQLHSLVFDADNDNVSWTNPNASSQAAVSDHFTEETVCPHCDHTPHDRGGSIGMDEDYAWENFVPRVIAYNWSNLRNTDDNSKDEVLKNHTRFQDYKAMLYNLGFSVPEFSDIYMELVDELPFVMAGHDEKDLNVSWQFEPYMSELVVAYPTPPECYDKPMALCDLVARRANQPFTCVFC